MDVAQFRAEMESVLSDRLAEVKSLRSLCNDRDEDVAKALRRAAVVMLYAHYEGFAKFCLVLYIRFLGQYELVCSGVVSELVATSWDPIFSGLNSPSKNKYFKQILPDDTRLHAFSRRVEFVDGVDKARSMPVVVTEKAIDLESNLSVAVFKKNLCILGLDYGLVDKFSSKISKLIQWRHNIAHGGNDYEIHEEQLDELCQSISKLMDDFMIDLTSAMKNEVFRRAEAS